MAVKIIYLAHGTTTDNEAGLATGWLPGELSETGKQQAHALAEQTDEMQFDVIFCSDLQRALDTAQIGFANKYQIIPDERLRECNYGSMNGLADHFKERMEDFIYTAFPKGESYCDVERRVADFVKFLRNNFQHQQVAIVGHQAPQLALDVLLRGRTWQQAIDEDWRKSKSWKAGWRYTAK